MERIVCGDKRRCRHFSCRRGSGPLTSSSVSMQVKFQGGIFYNILHEHKNALNRVACRLHWMRECSVRLYMDR